MVLHLNKFESPSPKDALIVPSLVEFGSVVLEKKMFECCQCILSPLGKGQGPSFEQN